MGMKSTWAGQRIPDVWSSALKRRIARYRAEADQALDRIRQKIERG
jgi:hypothetical protein